MMDHTGSVLLMDEIYTFKTSIIIQCFVGRNVTD